MSAQNISSVRNDLRFCIRLKIPKKCGGRETEQLQQESFQNLPQSAMFTRSRHQQEIQDKFLHCDFITFCSYQTKESTRYN